MSQKQYTNHKCIHLHISSLMAHLNTSINFTIHKLFVSNIQWLINKNHQHHNSSFIPILDPSIGFDNWTNMAHLEIHSIFDLEVHPRHTYICPCARYFTSFHTNISYRLVVASHSYYINKFTCPIELENYHCLVQTNAILGTHNSGYTT